MRGKSARAEQASACLYLGCFFFDGYGEEHGDVATGDSTGTFQVVVEATNVKQALDRCETRIRQLRKTGSLFSRPTTIFLETIIELRGSFRKGLLVNYVANLGSPEQPPQIMCGIPGQKDTEAKSYGLTSKTKNGMDPFVDFGGKKIQAQRDSVREARLAFERAPAERAAMKAKEERAADRKKRQEQRERNRVLKATLSELR